MTDLNAAWTERYTGSVMNTFGPPKLVLTRGAGAHVWDEDGAEYVDLLGGIAVNSLGHAHPALLAAVTEQLATLGHISNFFASEPQITLAERLLALLVPEAPAAEAGRVFFTNSGAEANEAALKMTRRTGRTHVVVAEGGFHGRTMGALALTSKEAYRAPFEPLPGHVTFVPYGDVDALAAAVTDGDRGRPARADPGRGRRDRRARRLPRGGPGDRHALRRPALVRRGADRRRPHRCLVRPRAPRRPPRHRHAGQGPGRWLPIGAAVGLGAAATLLEPGNHGTTFGGNPVACAAALAVLDTIEAEDLLTHVATLGARLRAGLGQDPRVTEVRGEGLLIGLDLAADASAEVTAVALRHGFIINNPTPSAIRLAPPLVLTDADADAFLAAWPAILDEAMGAT